MTQSSSPETPSALQGRGYRELLQSAAAITGPSLISRVLGYIRDMLQAFFLGTGIGADAFTLAFVIPNLLRSLTAEGSLTAAFIPTFTRVRRSSSPERTREFTNTVFSSLALIVLGITLLGILFAPALVKGIAYGYKIVPGKLDLTVSLLRIMFPYILFISLAALCSAILNAHFRFGLAASSSIFFNLAMIATVFWAARRTPDPAYAFALGVVVGGLFQLLVQIPAVRGLGYSLRPRWNIRDKAVRKVGRLMLPGIVGLGIFQINLAFSRMLASFLAEGSVSALYYATRLAEVTLGLFAIAMAKALLPTLSYQAAEGDIESVKKTLLFSLKAIAVVTIPASIGLFLLARPIIQVLFERGAFLAESTELTAEALVFLALGLPFASGNLMLKKAFFSLEDTKTPVKVAGISVAFYLVTAFLGMHVLGIGGLALGLAITEVLYFAILWTLLQKKMGGIPSKDLVVLVGKIGVCAVCMGAALGLLRHYLTPGSEFGARLLILLVDIGAGLAAYGLCALVLIKSELRGIRALFQKPAEKETPGPEV
jgi:putative peptidoglycan lipid II flippase